MAYAPYFYACDAIKGEKLTPLCRELWPPRVGFYVVFQEVRMRSNTLSTFIDFIFEKQSILARLPGISIP